MISFVNPMRWTLALLARVLFYALESLFANQIKQTMITKDMIAKLPPIDTSPG